MNDLQATILKIFNVVSKLCDENNIEYYAIGGTCLGAVRHHGFIPWDDDLDIAVPIEQYDKFLLCMKEKLPKEYYVYDCAEKKEYRYIFAKVCLKDTTYIEPAEKKYPEAYKGIYIDIMPLSGVPHGKEQQAVFRKKIKFYYNMNYVVRYPYNEMNDWRLKVLWIVTRLLRLNVPYNRFSQKWLDYLRRFPLKESQLTGYVWSSRVHIPTFRTECFANHVDLRFEDTTVHCPAGYEEFLTGLFGDYQILPPANQQVTHRPLHLDLYHSFELYKQENKEEEQK